MQKPFFTGINDIGSTSKLRVHNCLHSRLVTLLAFVASAATGFSVQAPVQFNKDIRPIFANNCLTCHGPDKGNRKAHLRLDTQDGLFSALDSDYPVVPGKPDKSQVYLRITTTDPDDLMPKSKTGQKLSPTQINLIKRWIEQGAKYQGHWAYTLPVRPAAPKVKHASWTINPIDNFILERLQAEKLKPSDDADKRTLLRRLSFDLTGLPPTPEEVAAFEADKSKHAYETAVDRLLASPHYGERMAENWLDGVRYADTDGFHADNYRSVYPYRDYVIQAFNSNMRFDEFTREQIAGDLLPNATTEQKIASTYNRLSRSTEEGGAQPKEYLAKYAADRVRTTSEVWLGSTMGCCECHDHKFDPFTTKDFYSFEAFFADIKEQGVGGREGTMVPDNEQAAEIKKLDENTAALQKALDTPTPELEAAQLEWERSLKPPQLVLSGWHSAGPFKAKSFDEGFNTAYEPENKIDLFATYVTNTIKWVPQPKFADGVVHQGLQPELSSTYLYRTITVPAPRTLKLYLGSDDGIKVWLNGKSVLANKIERGPTPDEEQIEVSLLTGENTLLMKIVNGKADSGFYFQAGAPSKMVEILKIPRKKRTTAQRAELVREYSEIAPQLAKPRAELAAAKAKQVDYLKTIPTTLATVSETPRVTRILPRGNWMSDAGAIVTPAPPLFLVSDPLPKRRETRLDLANWLMSPKNPLTARVFVNRLWKMYFGTGLSKNLDDLGTRGEWPTHPELLDWLATEFEDSGWDVKHMVKLMVMCHTYRQTAAVTDKLRERDPDNRLLARQSAIRLDAEFIHDNALAVSGLLVNKIGGPSVKPYQPEGFWDQLNFPKRTYVADHGDALYRRGLYTFWCRTFLQPSLQAFDAPSREECTIDRVKSNTPLQALALLNDPTYVEAARTLGEEIVRQGGSKVDDRINWTFMRTLDRKPTKQEMELLGRLYEQEQAHYAGDAKDAKELISVGERPVPKDLNPGEVAAWTSVARVVLNLHETITRY
jgi:hypothetical protein